MSFKVQGEMTGLTDLLAQLNTMKQGARNKVLRPAVAVGVQIVAKAVKAKAPVNLKVYVRTKAVKGGGTKQVNVRGVLKKAVGSTVKVGRGGVIVGKVGVRRGFKVSGGIVSRGPNKGKTIWHDPARIAHLVELGHGGPHPAPAHSFMRAGFDESKATASSAMIAEGKERLLALAAKGK